MKPLLILGFFLLLAGCAGFEGRGLGTQSTAADVERVMGTPVERRQVGGETWLYYPRQPFGRKTFVARLGADGRLIAIEQRLTDENVARLVPNTTRAEQVRELLGPPYNSTQFARMDRNVWTWHMRRYGDPGIPAQLNVQMSPDGVVREIYLLDESDSNLRNGVTLGFGFGR
jgi:outer membrane protein assembly factor BamE (lipoprotein component of BamABCDE complex)